MTSSEKVLCFGESLWDIAADRRMPGGAPMNVALCLAQLGVDARLATRVGDDELGRELVAYMLDRKLGTDLVQVDAARPTGSAIADLSNPHAVSYEIVTPAAWDYIDAAAYGSSIRNFDTLVFGSLVARSDVARASLLRLIECVELKVFDVNLRQACYTQEVVEALLERSDWVKVNETELDIIADWLGAQGSMATRLAAIRKRYDLEIACATLGAHGALMIGRDEEIFAQPAFDVLVVDTIGCGDAFVAAWLARLLAGHEPSVALQAGCAAGAIAASSAGATPTFSMATIQQLVDSD